MSKRRGPYSGEALTRRAVLPVVAGGLTIVGSVRSTFAAHESLAETGQGRVRGASVGGVQIFRGIPYGGPTEGAGRFLPPSNPPKWAGVRDATQTGPRAIQAPGNLFDDPHIGDYFCGGQEAKLGLDQQKDSENCLVLNVLTPALTGRRPVMVYIHGGGFTAGSGVIAIGADKLVSEQDIVLVSINHRLNVFGYTYLGDLSPKYADSGNAGQLDLVAALEWVRNNISGFGGDPRNVTIFGESGGGGKVSALMAMPAAKGLFSKAIVESGSSLRVANKEQATERAKAILAKLGIAADQVDKLQEVPASQLFAATSGGGSGIPGGGGPIIDGRSIPQQTWDPEAPPISSEVPMIVGSCQEETTWMIGRGDESTFTLDEAGLRSRLAENVGAPASTVDKVVGIYRSVRPKATPADLFFQITSDRGARMNAITQAERKTRLGKAPAYMYYFTYQTPMEAGKWRAFHTAELPLVFRMVRYPDAEQVSKQLSAAWAAFARNGNPNHRGIPSWRAYNLEERPTMVFGGERSQVENDPYREARSIFAALPPARRPGGR